MIALGLGKPDRLPITIHQWQTSHLEQFMGGMDQVEAFRAVGLDASVTPTDLMQPLQSPEWVLASEVTGESEGQCMQRHTVRTPEGALTWTTASNRFTTFTVEHPVKTIDDLNRFASFWPGATLDKERLRSWYDRTGDTGIVRGFVATFAQPGCWQEFCELAGTEQAIYWAMDEPASVHDFLAKISRTKVAYVQSQMHGAKYDLIEHGGGAASSTVISPAMFDAFVVPYDRPIIDAIHAAGFPVVYHTCGGMMAILDHIPATGCDASETLSPPGVGGDIHPTDRVTVKQKLGSRVALIGGVDQGELLKYGSAQNIRDEVGNLFASFGAGGGYICSASDHFFDVSVDQLRAMSVAAMDCRY